MVNKEKDQRERYQIALKMKIISRIIILHFLIHYYSACPASRRFIKRTTTPPWTPYTTPYPTTTPYQTPYPTPWPSQASTFTPNLTTSIPSIPGRIKAIKIKTGPEGMKKGTLRIQICSGVWDCCKIPKLGRGILRAFKANQVQTFIAVEISKCDNFSLPTMKQITITKSVVSKSWTGATLLISYTL